MRLRSNDSCQRITRRISGCVKNVFSCQLPSKVKPGGAIAAKIGFLSSGPEPSPAPRGICFQPSAYEPARGCNVETRSRYTLNPACVTGTESATLTSRSEEHTSELQSP